MTLDVGFLGYRFMGKAHANALARLSMFFPDAPEVNRAVMVGRNQDAVADAADRFGFDRWTDDWEEALDDVDVFYNLGPTHVHAEPTIAALERDIHVMCEKPMARDLETARRMRDAADNSEAIAGIGFNYRYVPALQLAKRLIDDGLLGDIYRVKGRCLQDWLADPSAEWNWRTDEARAGTGVLGDVGAHTLDLVQWLVGDIDRLTGQLTIHIPERPASDGNGAREVTTDDEYSALAEFESGAVGVFEGSRVATGREADNSIEIYGSDGAIEFSLRRLNELRVYETGDRGYEDVLVTDPSDPYIDAWWPAGHIIGWEHTFVHENYEFLTSVSESEPYRPNFDDGLRVHRAITAIEQSDDAGTWVDV